MTIVRTDEFSRGLRVLPRDVSRLAETQLLRLENNWHDPRLHIKRLRGFNEHYSFRITSRYRIIFYFAANNTLVLVAVGHRKDIYR